MEDIVSFVKSPHDLRINCEVTTIKSTYSFNDSKKSILLLMIQPHDFRVADEASTSKPDDFHDFRVEYGMRSGRIK